MPPEQLHALTYLAVAVHSYGFGIGLVFIGFARVARGYLILKSGYFPKALGGLIAIAGLCYLISSFALLLADWPIQNEHRPIEMQKADERRHFCYGAQEGTRTPTMLLAST